VDAYVYFYSIMSMDVSRRNSPTARPISESDEHFVNVPNTRRQISRGRALNFDTLYSVSWLDMTKEPVGHHGSDTDALLICCRCLTCGPMFLRSRAGERRAPRQGLFLVTPAGWRPDLRDRFAEEFKLPKDTQRHRCAKPYVWLIGRTKTDGPPDYDAVHKSSGRLQGHRFFPELERRPSGRIQAGPPASI